MSGIEVIVQRDSVCAGDDVDAPHEKSFWLNDGAPVCEVFRELAASGYLPSIAGSNEHWEATINGEVVCRFGKNIENPEYVISASKDLAQLCASYNAVKIRLIYFAARS